MSQNALLPPLLRIALFTLPAPQLYDAMARFQSPKISYASFMYCAAASADFTGSSLSSTNESIWRSYIFAVEYMNCHIPFAPTLETALGFNADSIMAIAFSSSGMSYLFRISSKIGM